MALEIVASNSTEIEHLIPIGVKFSGMHIDGGIYVSASRNPTSGGSWTEFGPSRHFTSILPARLKGGVAMRQEPPAIPPA